LIAAVLTERGLGGDSPDLDARLDALRRDRSPRAMAARQAAQRWAAQADEGVSVSPEEGGGPLSAGVALALAFPDRIAKNRGDGSFLLANGRGAGIDRASHLARAPFLAVAELAGHAAQARILLAAEITAAAIESWFADRIASADEITFDAAAMALR